MTLSTRHWVRSALDDRLNVCSTQQLTFSQTRLYHSFEKESSAKITAIEFQGNPFTEGVNKYNLW